MKKNNIHQVTVLFVGNAKRVMDELKEKKISKGAVVNDLVNLHWKEIKIKYNLKVK